MLERRRGVAQAAAIPRRAGREPSRLSFAQQRMWFLQQWDPAAPTFNGCRAVRLRGELDTDALRRALVRLVERHDTLRTVFVMDGREPLQLVLETWSLDLPLVDLSGAASEGREEALRRSLRELAREPFDLARDLTLRATLFRLAPLEHVLLLRLHHVAADGFSDAALNADLAAAYEACRAGREPELPELPIRYADFALWERERLTGERLEALLAYWTARLEGAPLLLGLPTDRPRPDVQRHEGAHRPLALDARLGESLAALARTEGATFFMAALAAFATLLYRISGEDDVVVGSPIANRTAAELRPLVGFFCNTVALRVRLAGNPSFREVVGRAREAVLGAVAHQELPFDKVVEALRLPRNASRNPVFQVNLRADAGPRSVLRLVGLESEPIPVDIGFSRFDLALELQAEPDLLGGYVEYDRDLFEAATVDGLAGELEALLEQVVADPSTPVLALALPGRTRR
jgi:hypothetical protein